MTNQDSYLTSIVIVLLFGVVCILFLAFFGLYQAEIVFTDESREYCIFKGGDFQIELYGYPKCVIDTIPYIVRERENGSFYLEKLK